MKSGRDDPGKWVWSQLLRQLSHSNTLPASRLWCLLWPVALLALVPLPLPTVRSPVLWEHYPWVLCVIFCYWAHLLILMIWSLYLFVASLPPCLPLGQGNQIWAWKSYPKAHKYQPQTDWWALKKYPFFGGSFGGTCQSQKYPFCGSAQLSSICSDVFQPHWWAKCFLVFILAASWAP